MPTGTVKWFNNAKGYGFILPEGGGDDLFVHYSSIDMDGYKTLKAGQAVEYETGSGEKGYHARNVRSCGTDADDRPPPPAPGDGEGAVPRPARGRAEPDSIAGAMLWAARDD